MRTTLLILIALTLFGCQKNEGSKPYWNITFINNRSDTVYIFTDRGSAFDVAPSDTLTMRDNTGSTNIYGAGYKAYGPKMSLITTGKVNYTNVIN